MATLSKKQNGTFEIQFRDGRGTRKTVFLGRRYTERTAADLHTAIEQLIDSQGNSAPLDRRTKGWLETASPEILDKLMNVGLIEMPKRTTLKELWDGFQKQKTGIKDATTVTYDTARQRFFETFPADELLTELTQARMEQWKAFLRTEAPRTRTHVPGLAESTVAGILSKTKAVFNWAVRSGLIEKSPLDGVGRGSFVNRKKDRYITPDEYRRLLDACPCQDWRVIIALARIGGIRCPSEVLRFRWSDINWETGRFYVRSPKTEHHAGKEGRLVPLFPDLRIELERLFEADSSEGAEFVISRYRDPERTNLGTQFGRIVQLAGIEPIEKPFTNMRASRSTEIYAEFGAFLESKWIGHSSRVAQEHYLQVREEDYERAIRPLPMGNVDRNSDFTVKKPAFHCAEKILTVKSTVARGGNGRKRAEGKKMKKGGKP